MNLNPVRFEIRLKKGVKAEIIKRSLEDLAKDITINITGLKDRIVPLESITMSGLDEDTDFLEKSDFIKNK
jgi:hypothetical protein